MPWLFETLSRHPTARKPAFSFDIPETFVLRRGQPIRAVFSSQGGRINMQSEDQLRVDSVVESLSNPDWQVSATTYATKTQRNLKTQQERSVLSIGHLSSQQVGPYIESLTEQPEQYTVLQRFVPLTSRSHCMFCVEFKGSTVSVWKVTNKLSFTDLNAPLKARLLTVESATGPFRNDFSKWAGVANDDASFYSLKLATVEVLSHVRSTLNKQVISGSLYFKLETLESVQDGRPEVVGRPVLLFGLGLTFQATSEQLSKSPQKAKIQSADHFAGDCGQRESEQLELSRIVEQVGDVRQSVGMFAASRSRDFDADASSDRDLLKRGNANAASQGDMVVVKGAEHETKSDGRSEGRDANDMSDEFARQILEEPISQRDYSSQKSFRQEAKYGSEDVQRVLDRVLAHLASLHGTCAFCRAKLALSSEESCLEVGLLNASQVMRLYDYYERNPAEVLLIPATTEEQSCMFEDLYDQVTETVKAVPGLLLQVFGHFEEGEFWGVKGDNRFAFKEFQVCTACFEGFRKMTVHMCEDQLNRRTQQSNASKVETLEDRHQQRQLQQSGLSRPNANSLSFQTQRARRNIGGSALQSERRDLLTAMKIKILKDSQLAQSLTFKQTRGAQNYHHMHKQPNVNQRDGMVKSYKRRASPKAGHQRSPDALERSPLENKLRFSLPKSYKVVSVVGKKKGAKLESVRKSQSKRARDLGPKEDKMVHQQFKLWRDLQQQNHISVGFSLDQQAIQSAKRQKDLKAARMYGDLTNGKEASLLLLSSTRMRPSSAKVNPMQDPRRSIKVQPGNQYFASLRPRTKEGARNSSKALRSKQESVKRASFADEKSCYATVYSTERDAARIYNNHKAFASFKNGSPRQVQVRQHGVKETISQRASALAEAQRSQWRQMEETFGAGSGGDEHNKKYFNNWTNRVKVAPMVPQLWASERAAHDQFVAQESMQARPSKPVSGSHQSGEPDVSSELVRSLKQISQTQMKDAGQLEGNVDRLIDILKRIKRRSVAQSTLSDQSSGQWVTERSQAPSQVSQAVQTERNERGPERVPEDSPRRQQTHESRQELVSQRKMSRPESLKENSLEQRVPSEPEHQDQPKEQEGPQQAEQPDYVPMDEPQPEEPAGIQIVLELENIEAPMQAPGRLEVPPVLEPYGEPEQIQVAESYVSSMLSDLAAQFDSGQFLLEQEALWRQQAEQEAIRAAAEEAKSLEALVRKQKFEQASKLLEERLAQMEAAQLQGKQDLLDQLSAVLAEQHTVQAQAQIRSLIERVQPVQLQAQAKTKPVESDPDDITEFGRPSSRLRRRSSQAAGPSGSVNESIYTEQQVARAQGIEVGEQELTDEHPDTEFFEGLNESLEGSLIVLREQDLMRRGETQADLEAPTLMSYEAANSDNMSDQQQLTERGRVCSVSSGLSQQDQGGDYGFAVQAELKAESNQFYALIIDAAIEANFEVQSEEVGELERLSEKGEEERKEVNCDKDKSDGDGDVVCVDQIKDKVELAPESEPEQCFEELQETGPEATQTESDLVPAFEDSPVFFVLHDRILGFSTQNIENRTFGAAEDQSSVQEDAEADREAALRPKSLEFSAEEIARIRVTKTVSPKGNCKVTSEVIEEVSYRMETEQERETLEYE